MTLFRFAKIVVLSTLALSVMAASSWATDFVPSNFNGYGTTVHGFQDFFTESSLNNGNWTEISNASAVTAGSSGNFTLGGGYLHINGGAGDPNKLLYSGATYSATNQNVLAMIEVTGGSNGDGFRGGVGAQSNATNGQGIDEVFRQNGGNGDTVPGGSGNHVNFLDDGAAWGPIVGGSNSWSLNTFYWLRETTDSSGNITGEIWRADGVTPESSALTGTWSASGPSGLAGLVADSSGGNGTFMVNYLLIQASGLPLINVVVPEPSSVLLLTLGSTGLVAFGWRRQRNRRRNGVQNSMESGSQA